MISERIGQDDRTRANQKRDFGKPDVGGRRLAARRVGSCRFHLGRSSLSNDAPAGLASSPALP